MQAIKTVFEAIPETIEVPPELVHKRGEIIIIVEDDVSTTAIRTFYGSLPDFPERTPQGMPETGVLITANTGEFSRIPGLAIDNWETPPPG